MLKHENAVPTKPNRVVLLGGSGFLGQALEHVLRSEGVETLTLSSKDLDLASEDSAERLSDLIKPDDALVFLAALTPDKGKGIDTLMTNLKMGEHVAAAIAEVKPAHVIYISSDAVYPLSEPFIDEQTLAAPTDLYGTMHRTRELMMASTGVPLAILRPTLIYGSGDTHNSYGPNRFRRLAAETSVINLGGEGEETRDHIKETDVAQVISLVLTMRSVGVLNVATGVSTSFYDVAQMVQRFLPQTTIQTSDRQVPITHRKFDVSALYKAFPTFTCQPLSEGLKDTIGA